MKNWLFLGLFFSCLVSLTYTNPPTQIPENLRAQFTLQGKIPVQYMDWDCTHSDDTPQFYSCNTIDAYIENVKEKKCSLYGNTDLWLYQAFESHPIEGKNVAVIGSINPWYESIILAFGGKPITITSHKMITDDPRLIIMTPDEYENNPIQFDIVLSVSNTAREGLGIDGEPLNPNGDLEFMDKVKNQMLKPEGCLFLAIPCGSDCLTWNAGRIYGPYRFPLLIQEWNKIACFGVDSFEVNSRLFYGPLGDSKYKPVFLLRPSAIHQQ